MLGTYALYNQVGDSSPAQQHLEGGLTSDDHGGEQEAPGAIACRRSVGYSRLPLTLLHSRL